MTISEVEASVLRGVDEHRRRTGDGPLVAELATYACRSTTLTNGCVAGLLRRGLLTRNDRSRRSLRVTSEGYAALRGFASAAVDPKAPRLHTASGRSFYPFAPRAEDVVLDDLATALSNLCRFNGHVGRFYSVAQHSVLVMQRATQLASVSGQDASQLDVVRTLALLHDCATAYLSDVPTPIRQRIGVVADRGDGVAWERFVVAERRVRREVFYGLGVGRLAELPDLGSPAWDVVTLADREVLSTELVRLKGVDADSAWLIDCPPPLDMDITPMTPGDACATFLGAAAACGLTPIMGRELEEAEA